jgi:hypothetical protein
VSFSSSNDSSMLKVFQRDGLGSTSGTQRTTGATSTARRTSSTGWP